MLQNQALRNAVVSNTWALDVAGSSAQSAVVLVQPWGPCSSRGLQGVGAQPPCLLSRIVNVSFGSPTVVRGSQFHFSDSSMSCIQAPTSTVKGTSAPSPPSTRSRTRMPPWHHPCPTKPPGAHPRSRGASKVAHDRVPLCRLVGILGSSNGKLGFYYSHARIVGGIEAELTARRRGQKLETRMLAARLSRRRWACHEVGFDRLSWVRWEKRAFHSSGAEASTSTVVCSSEWPVHETDFQYSGQSKSDRGNRGASGVAYASTRPEYVRVGNQSVSAMLPRCVSRPVPATLGLSCGCFFLSRAFSAAVDSPPTPSRALPSPDMASC